MIRTLHPRGRLAVALASALAVLGAMPGCGGAGSSKPFLTDFLNDPAYPQDHWATATPEEEGLDSKVLAEGANQSPWVHSMLVVRHGKLVFERYNTDYQAEISSVYHVLRDRLATPGPNRPDEPHHLWSVTKSFVATLVGIAVDEGAIGSVHDAVLPYFPDYAGATGAGKADMTVEDVLQMSSGLTQDDSYSNVLMLLEGDAALNVLSRPMAAAPGAVFNYSSGNSQVLAGLLTRATGRTPAAYAEEKLFAPLGISRWSWGTDDSGVNVGGFTLYVTPRDMAKLGQLYLQQGVWNGRQVVSAAWVKAATETCSAASDREYCYQWWRFGDQGFQAIGHDGQKIYVLPAEDIVVVFTSQMEPYDVLDTIVTRYVLPAVRE